ncbi:hypothetical protein H2201_006618 [Coniosporium apollinis]|uniref:Uncharacterized protein n=1 Tax=Coniosporium apollinis TaxID=61459 RepID=A0ABQ9NNX0_9PEZI|nr:hypothetical protein H2201_006618 [Coniosporium apollinis]
MASYTPLQQDRQARNKATHKAPAAGSSKTTAKSAQQPSNTYTDAQLHADETFEERERRHNAARTLESNEMLIWLSMSRNESVPQIRLYYERVLAGFDPDANDGDREEDEVREKGSRKSLGKERGGGSSPGKGRKVKAATGSGSKKKRNTGSGAA